MVRKESKQTTNKRRLHRLIWVYTRQNATFLEITCHGSILFVSDTEDIEPLPGEYTEMSRDIILADLIYKGKHSCSTCGKTFKSKTLLENHLRVHTGDRPYECEVCGKKFIQKAHLKTHRTVVHLMSSMYVQTEVRPYKCQQCGKRFKLKHHLKIHHAVHMNDHMYKNTAARPFECELCRKRFKLKSHLKTHHLIHMKV